MKTKIVAMISILTFLSGLISCSSKGTGSLKKICTIDPFEVNGMTIVSTMRNDKLTAYASDFVAAVEIPSPNKGKILFRASGLHNTDFCVYVNERKVWEPDISGFKDFEDSLFISLALENRKSKNVTIKLIVRGLHGGLQLFEIYEG